MKQLFFTINILFFAYFGNTYANQSGSYIKTARSFFQTGSIFEKNNEPEIAESFYNIALSLCEKDKSGQSLQIRILSKYASLLSDKGETEASLKKKLEAVIIAKAIDDKEMLGVLYHNIGGGFNVLRQYDVALQYFEKSIENRRYTNDFEGFSLTFANIAHYYWDNNDLEKMAQYVDSISYYDSKIDNPYTKKTYYQYKGMLMDKRGFKNEAADYYKKALEVAENNNLDYSQYDVLGLLYNLYYQQKEYGKCKYYIQKYYTLAKKMGNKSGEIEALEELATLAEHANDYKSAYEYINQFTGIKDSLTEKNIEIQVNKLEKEFNRKEDQKEIENLKLENQQKEKILKLNKQIYIAIALLIMLSIIIIYLYSSNRNYKQKALLNVIRQQKEKEIALALIQGQEQERQRIAQELHDGLGGLLTSAKIQLQLHETLPEELSKVTTLLDHSIEELRQISHNLASISTKYSLEDAIKNFCINKRNIHPQITLEIDEQLSRIDLPYSFKVNIYRIIQELINNARKHAQAEKLFVQILIDKQTLLLSVEDDGIGFDRNTDERKGLGLVNIRNRVAYFSGTLQIQGFPGKGACIYIGFDLNKIE